MRVVQIELFVNIFPLVVHEVNHGTHGRRKTHVMPRKELVPFFLHVVVLHWTALHLYSVGGNTINDEGGMARDDE